VEILEPGYRFATVHNEAGNVAHVDGHYERFQTQAPIQSRQRYELEFYGNGAGIELGVTSIPRRAVPAAMAAARRAEMSRPDAVTSTIIDSAAPATATLARTARPDLSNTPTPTSPLVSAMTVGPEFHSPFDENWFDGWGIDQPPFPPSNWPPQPPGGGGGGTYHSAVRIELFVYGEDQPIATWELPEGIGPRQRTVKYEPQGFPAPDAPVRRTGWWYMAVTPLGPDPVEIYIAAHVKLGEVPIRTTPLTVRLTNHLFRVGFEALVPQAVVEWDRLFVSIGPEIAELIGLDPTILEQSIGPGNSHARLRTLDISAISGAELHTIARDHYRDRARRYPIPGNMTSLTVDQKVAFFFKKQLERLAEVKDDFVCIRIQAQFTDASLSVWGFDVASLNGELGELVLAFDYRMERCAFSAFSTSSSPRSLPSRCRSCGCSRKCRAT
jgi:prepilin-type processing-associated H-X9-DG protein